MTKIFNQNENEKFKLQLLSMKLNAVISKSAEAGDNTEEIKSKLIEFLNNIDVNIVEEQ
jgi:ElaB/YqjD/DUF883 family membrane-anchored ribosome-binding protein